MLISSKTLQQIKTTFSSAPIEAGGIIGMTGRIISAFYFDKDNYNTDCYIPNTVKLNAIIKKWKKNNIQFAGLIHSHANDCRLLSDTDKAYALKIFKAANLRRIYFPLVTFCNGKIILTSYYVEEFNIKGDGIKVVY